MDSSHSESSYVRQVDLGFSFQVDLQYTVEQHVGSLGGWEQHISSFLRFFLKPGETCVDVGANSGFHTLTMAALVGREGRVYAFEPSHRTFERLQHNIQLNPDFQKGIIPLNLGLGETCEQLSVFPAGSEGNAYVRKEADPMLWDPADAPPSEICYIVPADSILAGQPVALVKIDVEGMELEVLKGAGRMLSEARPIIIYESLTSCFGSEKLLEIQTLLEEKGYSLVSICTQSGKLIPAKYPDYTEDTFAYPNERALDLSEILLAAAEFNVLTGSGENVGVLRVCGSGSEIHAGGVVKGIPVSGRGPASSSSPRTHSYSLNGSSNLNLTFDIPELNRGMLHCSGEELALVKRGGLLNAGLLSNI
jgi:FkbM family methyltransferase